MLNKILFYTRLNIVQYSYYIPSDKDDYEDDYEDEYYADDYSEFYKDVLKNIIDLIRFR